MVEVPQLFADRMVAFPIMVIGATLATLLVIGLLIGGLVLLGKATGSAWVPLLLVIVVGGAGAVFLMVSVLWLKPGHVETTDATFPETAAWSPATSRARRVQVDVEPPVVLPNSGVDSVAAAEEDDAASDDVSAEVGDGPIIPLDGEPTTSESRPAPAWTGATTRRVGDVVQMVVSEGPHTRRIDCHKGLNSKLSEAAKDYAENFVARDSRDLVDVPLAYLREYVVADEYVEQKQHPFGPGFEDQQMFTVHLLLEFDPKDDEVIRQQLKRSVVDSRLWYAGFGVSAALAVLATAFGFLRIDQATEGKYKGRLKLAAAAVILALGATGALLARFIALA